MKIYNSDEAVSPPWIKDWPALVSWLDMLEFSAHKFHGAGSTLGWLRHVLADQIEQNTIRGSTLKMVSAGLLQLSEQLREIGCKVSGGMAASLSLDVEGKFISGEVLKAKVGSLQEAITREMDNHLFLWVSSQKVDYYSKSADDLISPEFVARFPVASEEFSEGCKCYACNRPTAAVFHFMRAMDATIRAFGILIGYSHPTNNNWGKVFEAYDKQLKLPLADRPAIWQTEGVFLQALAGDFKAVQKAWRDATMHLENTYTDSQALDILRAIVVYMRQLSTRLDENGNLV